MGINVRNNYNFNIHSVKDSKTCT